VSGAASAPGCGHRDGDPNGPPGQWCYMSATAPDVLSCAQHDKFEDIRKETGRFIQRQAGLMSLFAAALVDVRHDYNSEKERK